MKILVTGATGMLGRAVMKRFSDEKDFELVGLCHTRTGEGLVPADLLDEAGMDALLREQAPDVVVHTAAIRKPDEFAADVEAARRLNVDATAALARWTAAAPERRLVYLSTDYVFDGTKPPYVVDDLPHPINAYGISKRDGEDAVRAVAAAQSAILRVPILYGDVETLQESSVTTVLAQVLKLSRRLMPQDADSVNGSSSWSADLQVRGTVHLGARVFQPVQPLVLDDWAIRYPTHVADVADILAQIVRKRLVGTFHWSGSEALTKLDMGRVAAARLGLDASLLRGSGAPANGSEPRPKDCHLDCSALTAQGVSTPGIPFAVAMSRLIDRCLKGDLV